MLLNEKTNAFKAVLRSDQKLIFLIGITFLLYVAVGLNGFSISRWDEILGEPHSTQVLEGKARSIRSDDFLASIPLALAQIAHKPPFPAVNSLIGDGENMLLLPYAPINHYLTVFKPQTWGFFIGPNTGLSWWWACRMAGTFISCLIICRLILGRESLYQLTLPLIFLFSPFVQFWSGNAGEMIFHGFIASASFYGVLSSRRIWKILSFGVILGYCASAEALLLYPGYSIPIAYASFAVGLTLLVLNSKIKKILYLFKWRILALATACLILGCVGFTFWRELEVPIVAVSQTVYPGQRVSLGGDLPLIDLFVSWTIDQQGFYLRNFTVNICEGASFFFLTPMLILLFLFGFFCERKRNLKSLFSFWILIACFLFLSSWSLFGLPSELAKYSFLSMVPGRRAVIGLGMLDFTLVCFYLSMQKQGHAKVSSTFGRYSILMTLSILSLAYFLSVSKRIPEFSTLSIALSVLVFTGIGAAFVFNRPQFAIAAILILSLRNTFHFNPIVWHGSEVLMHNSLIARLQEDQNNSRNENIRWLVVNFDQESSMLRAGGISCLNGYHFVPQIDLWKHVDRDGKFLHEYNRYANVKARLTSNSKADEVSFYSDHSDSFEIRLTPSRINAERLSFNRILAPCDKHGDLLLKNGWTQFATVRNYCMWKLPPG